MPLTYLRKEEKLVSLLYVAKNELSSNKVIQDKQYEVLKYFWNNYIHECDYSLCSNNKNRSWENLYLGLGVL